MLLASIPVLRSAYVRVTLVSRHVHASLHNMVQGDTREVMDESACDKAFLLTASEQLNNILDDILFEGFSDYLHISGCSRQLMIHYCTTDFCKAKWNDIRKSIILCVNNHNRSADRTTLMALLPW